MKYAGIALLCIGVAISAAYGARLSPSVRSQMVARGEAQFRAAETAAAKTAYCNAMIELLAEHDAQVRAIADGEDTDDCPLPGAGAASEGAGSTSSFDVTSMCAERATAGGSFDDVVRTARERLTSRRAVDVDPLGEEVTHLRAGWLDAADAEVEPAARVAVLRPVDPEERVREWFAESGPFFLLGLLLVVVGAVLGRIAARKEARSEPESTDRGAARDLGAMLDELREKTARLAEQAKQNESPSPADHAGLRDRIDALRVENFEPLVEAGPRMQVKYGMGPFADVFGPLASAERLCNRAWSALVDDHWPEATSSLERSAASLQQAHETLEAIVTKHRAANPSASSDA